MKKLQFIAFLLLILFTAKAQQKTEINWPEKFQPSKSKFHVRNEIEISAPPESVWKILIDAKNWSSFYKGIKDISFIDSTDLVIMERSVMKWETMGRNFTSYVKAYIPNNYIAWEFNKKNIQGYHVWLILPTEKGCKVITEESQNGSLTFFEKLFQGKKLGRMHQAWLQGMKEKAESNTTSVMLQ